MTRALTALLAALALTWAGWLTGLGSSSASAATVDSGPGVVNVALDPVETWAVVVAGPNDVCATIVLPWLAAAGTPLAVTSDQCNLAIKRCAGLAHIDQGWGAYTRFFTDGTHQYECYMWQ